MSNAISTVEYRDIQDFPAYRVGNDGSIWSRWKKVGKHKWEISECWRRLKATPDDDGYPRVTLCHQGRQRQLVQVHKIVLESFVGPCQEGMECRHLDGIRNHNFLRNLCWGTTKENADDRKRHGTNIVNVGESNGGAKLTRSQVDEIRSRKDEKKKDLAKEFGISTAQLWRILTYKKWK